MKQNLEIADQKLVDMYSKIEEKCLLYINHRNENDIIENSERSLLLYVYGSKATRVERWRNLQPYAGDCKVGIIPHRHIKIKKSM